MLGCTAWPMDFNRSLTSFRPHLEACKNIIQLALDSASSCPVKVLFSSSIAVVGRYPVIIGSRGAIPEGYLDDPEAIDHFGYAEAKWVCEKMFERAAEVFGTMMVANSVRIGQMAGAEMTGAWNAAEHLPMIVKSCKAIGWLPIIEGVRLVFPYTYQALTILSFINYRTHHGYP
jgi:thioester reductase-like protein